MTRYPTLKQRYLSSLVDGVVLLFVILAGTIAYQGEDPRALAVRFAVVLAILLSYEPLLTSQLCTMGHLMVGIRVRDHSDPTRKISIVRAYFRTVVKILLGGYSFFAMGFNRERRAAHDFVVKSVVVEANSEPAVEQSARVDI